MTFKFGINQKMSATVATEVWNVHNVFARYSCWWFHSCQNICLGI